MIVGISSKGKGVDSEIDEVFGRCSYFIIVDLKDDGYEVIKTIENISRDQKGHAGVSAAKRIAEEEVEAVLTGNLGPRAKDIFDQFGIKIFYSKGRIKDSLKDIIDGTDLSSNGKETKYSAVRQSDKGDIIIAVPTEGEKGLLERVSPHFGRSRNYTLLNEEGEVIEIIENTSEHKGGKGLPPELLKENNVNVLLCLGLGARALKMFNELGIDVYVCEGRTVKEFFDAWKEKRISKASSDDVCIHNH